MLHTLDTRYSRNIIVLAKSDNLEVRKMNNRNTQCAKFIRTRKKKKRRRHIWCARVVFTAVSVAPSSEFHSFSRVRARLVSFDLFFFCFYSVLFAFVGVLRTWIPHIVLPLLSMTCKRLAIRLPFHFFHSFTSVAAAVVSECSCLLFLRSFFVHQFDRLLFAGTQKCTIDFRHTTECQLCAIAIETKKKMKTAVQKEHWTNEERSGEK